MKITYRDIHTLKPGVWLNDQVSNNDSGSISCVVGDFSHANFKLLGYEFLW